MYRNRTVSQVLFNGKEPPRSIAILIGERWEGKLWLPNQDVIAHIVRRVFARIESGMQSSQQGLSILRG